MLVLVQGRHNAAAPVAGVLLSPCNWAMQASSLTHAHVLRQAALAVRSGACIQVCKSAEGCMRPSVEVRRGVRAY